MTYIEALNKNGWHTLSRNTNPLIEVFSNNDSINENTDIYYHQDLLAFIIDVKKQLRADITPVFRVSDINFDKLIKTYSTFDSTIKGIETEIKSELNNKLEMVNSNLDVALSYTQPTIPEDVDISKVLIRVYVSLHEKTTGNNLRHTSLPYEIGYNSGIAFINKDEVEAINSNINIFSNNKNIQHDINISTLKGITQHCTHLDYITDHVLAELNLIKDEIHADILDTIKKYNHNKVIVDFKNGEHTNGFNDRDDIRARHYQYSNKTYCSVTYTSANATTTLRLFTFNPVIDKKYDEDSSVPLTVDVASVIKFISYIFHPDYKQKISDSLTETYGDAFYTTNTVQEFILNFDEMLKIAYDITKVKAKESK